MNSILASTSPWSCDKLLQGTLLFDIRRQRPDVSGPFRVYVYCTKSGDRAYRLWVRTGSGAYVGNEKVIGEYMCNDVAQFSISSGGRLITDRQLNFEQLIAGSGFTSEQQLIEYIRGGKSNCGRVWYVSDFKIYSKPKFLSDFDKVGLQTNVKDELEPNPLTHAPMSFAYVRRRTENIESDTTNLQLVRELSAERLATVISCRTISELRLSCDREETDSDQCNKCKLDWLRSRVQGSGH